MWETFLKQQTTTDYVRLRDGRLIYNTHLDNFLVDMPIFLRVEGMKSLNAAKTKVITRMIYNPWLKTILVYDPFRATLCHNVVDHLIQNWVYYNPDNGYGAVIRLLIDER